MNRRSFIGRMVVGATSFAILPGAGRVWKAVAIEPSVLACEWSQLPEIVIPGPISPEIAGCTRVSVETMRTWFFYGKVVQGGRVRGTELTK